MVGIANLIVQEDKAARAKIVEFQNFFYLKYDAIKPVKSNQLINVLYRLYPEKIFSRLLCSQMTMMMITK